MCAGPDRLFFDFVSPYTLKVILPVCNCLTPNRDCKKPGVQWIINQNKKVYTLFETPINGLGFYYVKNKFS